MYNDYDATQKMASSYPQPGIVGTMGGQTISDPRVAPAGTSIQQAIRTNEEFMKHLFELRKDIQNIRAKMSETHTGSTLHFELAEQLLNRHRQYLELTDTIFNNTNV